MKQVNNIDIDQNNIDCIFKVHGDEQTTAELVFTDGKSVVVVIDSGAGINIISRKEFQSRIKTMPACHIRLRFEEGNGNMWIFQRSNIHETR